MPSPAASTPISRTLVVRDVRIEDAHRIRAAADARDDRVGLPSGGFRHLRQALAADHALEIAHHHRIRMRAGHGADDVERRLDVGDPVAHRLVQRVLQRLRSRLDRHHRRAEQLHPEHVLRLALARPPSPCRRRTPCRSARRPSPLATPCCPAPVSAITRFLPRRLREQRLADAVVDLVRTGVIEVLALQPDLRAAHLFRPALRVIDRRRAPDVVRELVLELGDEAGIVTVARVLLLELVERADQRLGDEHAAVRAEMAALVGKVIRQVSHLHCALPR